MSTNTIVLNTGQQAIINTDLSQVFIWQNRYDQADYNNPGYDPVTLPIGTVMGRVSATGLIKPLTSAAVDGSQYPVGILAETYIVEEGTTQPMYFCVTGDVVEDKVVLQGADTLNTVISGRRIRDRIGADTVGIKLVASTENTYYDNQ